MTKEKIDRTNELARKQKTPEGLTSEERIEQANLRKEYVDEIRNNLVSQLENTYIVDEKGNKTKVERKHNVETDNN